ncbi:MAG TPA: hypothetical protein VI300_12365, partial [Solirubrobacter sp.]
MNEVETSMLNRRRLIAAAVALAIPAALPAFASAASVSAGAAGAITLRDAGSETNAVTVTLDAGNWVIGDSAAPLTAGAGCTQSAANEVRCAQAATRPTAYLGGGDDTFAAPADGGWIVYGEGGSDHLTGGAGADTFFGGPGADTLIGAGGNDRLDGGTGDDVLRMAPGDVVVGGSGVDTARLVTASGFALTL